MRTTLLIFQDQGRTNPAFSKPCLCLSDTRHFRHFHRFRGSEERSPCFQWVECKWGIILQPQPLHTRQKYEQNMAGKLSSLPCFEAFGAIFCPMFFFFHIFALYVGGGGHSRASEQIRHFAVFVRTAPFWRGTQTRFTKNTLCATPTVNSNDGPENVGKWL